MLFYSLPYPKPYQSNKLHHHSSKLETNLLFNNYTGSAKDNDFQHLHELFLTFKARLQTTTHLPTLFCWFDHNSSALLQVIKAYQFISCEVGSWTGFDWFERSRACIFSCTVSYLDDVQSYKLSRLTFYEIQFVFYDKSYFF